MFFLSHFAFLIVNRLKYPHTHTLRQTPVAKFVKFHADHVKRQKKETEKTLERERECENIRKSLRMDLDESSNMLYLVFVAFEHVGV